MKLMTRKIAVKDYEFVDYKFKSRASKLCRHRMVKGFRAREKAEVRQELND